MMYHVSFRSKMEWFIKHFSLCLLNFIQAIHGVWTSKSSVTDWPSKIKHSGLRRNFSIQFCSYTSNQYHIVKQYEALLKSPKLGLVNKEKKFRYLNRLQEVMRTDGRTSLPCQSRVPSSWRVEWEPLSLIVLPRPEALRHTSIVYIYCYYLNKKEIRSPRMSSLINLCSCLLFKLPGRMEHVYPVEMFARVLISQIPSMDFRRTRWT